MDTETNNPQLPDETEEVHTGIVREWFNEKRIVAYRITAMTAQIVDAWADIVVDSLKAWPKDRPYLALHDLSQPGVSLQYAALVNFDMMNIGITMPGRILAEEIFDQHEVFKAKVAINFNLSLSGQTNRTLLNFLGRENPNIRYKTFYNRNKALTWLAKTDATGMITPHPDAE